MNQKRIEQLNTKLVLILAGILLALLIIGSIPKSEGASCLNPDCSPPPNNGRDILDFGY